jgi:membrane protein YdbS with pleckstrin-like domain
MNMEYNTLDRKMITYWYIVRFRRIFLFIIIIGIPTLILSRLDFFRPAASYVYGIEGLILLYLLAAAFLYPVIEYRQWGYLIFHDRVEIKHGIFFISTSIVPVIRIQHITIEHGIILRKLGLSSVRIHTASGTFNIMGLSNSEARSMIESLKNNLYTRIEVRGKV